ncbi:hypothetical protein [uncultured Anaerococcus sp.]|uniref:hypothetical protein n=1 Tax=uncultured Anaerococcus sp. TaxID=293428 RepID=UPI00288BF331|nr:hypothetical protein [uncultured Anaerococcus sp.]
MDRLKELKEAKVAAEAVIDKIDQAIKQLNSASNWGILDLLGGDFIPSLVKRNKIGKANDILKDLPKNLESLNKELSDVGISLPKGVPDRLSDELFDTIFDNVFTDFRVQGEIKENLLALKELRHTVGKISDKLDEQIADLES